MLYATRRFEFSASHRYWRDDWSKQRNEQTFGKCTSPYGHGHNYTLDVTIAGTPDRVTGMVMNMTDLKAIVGLVLEQFDHKYLNADTPYFQERIPTTENIVRVLWELIAPQMPEGVALARLRLYEMNDLWAEYAGEEQASFTRSYVFSAAHRLHAPQLSDEQNRRIYGKCNNPNGHGHNYVLEVSVRGEVPAGTGMVMNLTDLMRILREGVLLQVDHKHLNHDVPFLEGVIPTAENVAVALWERIQPEVERFEGCRLHRIRLYESRSSFVDYAGPGARV